MQHDPENRDELTIYHNPSCSKSRETLALIQAIAADPILLQRPIVVRGNEAVIGRPPENVKRLLRD